MKNKIRIVMLSVVMLAGFACAASDYDRLKPWLEDETVVVIGGDIGSIDTAVVCDELSEYIAKLNDPGMHKDEAFKDIDSFKALTGGYLTQFKADGIKSIYLCVNMNDLPSVYLVVLHEPGKGQCPTLRGLLQLMVATVRGLDKNFDTFVDINDTLLIGNAQTIQRIQNDQQVDRQDIAKALVTVDSYCIKLVYAPSDSLRRVLSETLTPIELETEHFTGSDINNSIQWAVAGLNVNKQENFTFMAQAQNEAAASRAVVLVSQLKDYVLKVDPVLKDIGIVDKIFNNVQPVTNKNMWRYELSREQYINALLPALFTVQAKTTLQIDTNTSATNIKLIMLSLIMYSDAHNNDMPETLDKLVGADLPTTTLVSPLKSLGTGYIYRGSDLNMKVQRPDQMIAVYERYNIEGKDSYIAGFMDGHVEMVKNKDDFNTALAKDNALRKEQGLAEKPEAATEK